MKVRLGTIEISDERRRKLNVYRGMKGLASRADVRRMALDGIYQYFVDMEYDVGEQENREDDYDV